ncbi:MAG: aromatic ring-hydroxylating oxygenase subunit alpha [Hyphomicrobiaceae bacterium]
MSEQRMMHVLPVDAYTSQDWFDREQELIFSRVWRYAGFVEDISEPGQYISVQAGLNNIFIVMGRDRRLRAFHNICRHRGTQLLRAVGKTQKAITCPYHDWTYDLEGALVSVPEEAAEFVGIDKTCLGLKSASVDLWRGMLFVHPDADAGSIVEWFGDIEPRLGPHKVEELVEYPEATTSYEIKANWKIVVENYIDVYHLAHLHSGTLAMYNHAKAEYGFVGPHYAFWEPLSDDYAENIEKNAPTPLILPLDQLGASVPMLFPGIGLAESESNWATFIVTPLAPDLTRIENRVRVKNASGWAFQKQEYKSASFWSRKITGKYAAEKDAAADDPMTGGDFTAEDIYACEQQQKSLQSPYFEVGASAASGESPVREHQQIVLDYMEGGRG